MLNSFLQKSTSYSPFGNMLINEKDFASFITIKRGLAEQSIRHCNIRIKVINKWISHKGLSKESVENFYLYLRNEKGLKNNSLNTYHFVFNQIVEYCKDRGIYNNFYEGFKSFKKIKPEIIIFTHEEIEEIINQKLEYKNRNGVQVEGLNFTYSTLTQFLAYTGVRYSEAANLKVKSIDWGGKARITGTKNNLNRTVYFTDPLLSNLKTLCKSKNDNEYVFTNSLNKPINYQTYSDAIKKKAKLAGITKRVFPHNFRHSYATHMLEIGIPITHVSKLLGHKDIKTTYDNYMHLADKTLEDAAMQHPMVRRYVDPRNIFKSIRQNFDNLHLELDPRFKYSISESDNSLKINISKI